MYVCMYGGWARACGKRDKAAVCLDNGLRCMGVEVAARGRDSDDLSLLLFVPAALLSPSLVLAAPSELGVVEGRVT